MSNWSKPGSRRSFAGFGRQLSRQAHDTADRWRDRVAVVAGRWKRLGSGERVNVVLYVLTGVSMVFLTVEFLAGPDNLPTEVTSAPAPIGSSGLTPIVPVSTTIDFGASPTTLAPALPQGPATTVRRGTTPQTAAKPPSSQPPGTPAPTAPPSTPAPTAPPTSKAPATTAQTGFTIVPPIPPSFPSANPAGNPSGESAP